MTIDQEYLDAQQVVYAYYATYAPYLTPAQKEGLIALIRAALKERSTQKEQA